MRWFSPKLIDDRERVHVIDFESWDASEHGDAREQLAIEHAASRFSYPMTRQAMLIAVLGVLAGMVILGTVGAALSWPLWSVQAGGPLGFVGGTTLAAVLERKKSAQAARRQMLSCGHCPVCAFPIATLPPEADGCIVCPECGAAWRHDTVERISPRHTLAPVRKGGIRRYVQGLIKQDWIADDAGREAPLLYQTPWRRARTATSEDVRGRMREVHKDVFEVAMISRVAVSGGFVIVAVMLFAVGIRGNTGGFLAALQSLFIIAGSLLMIVFAIASFFYGTLGIDPKIARTHLLRRGVCPCCSDELWNEDVEHDDEGRTICPSCGSRWRVEPNPAAAPPA
jgi:uncharacterized Zn finger protein (UPF0148 family)